MIDRYHNNIRCSKVWKEICIESTDLSGQSHTNIRFAKDNGLIGGNKNATYFINAKDKKFPMRTVEEFFHENKEMYKTISFPLPYSSLMWGYSIGVPLICNHL